MCEKPGFGFLFDIDGVILRGKKVLPSAIQAFKSLTDGKGRFRVPCIFVTNAGNTLRQNKAAQLSDLLGVEVRICKTAYHIQLCPGSSKCAELEDRIEYSPNF